MEELRRHEFSGLSFGEGMTNSFLDDEEVRKVEHLSEGLWKVPRGFHEVQENYIKGKRGSSSRFLSLYSIGTRQFELNSFEGSA